MQQGVLPSWPLGTVARRAAAPLLVAVASIALTPGAASACPACAKAAGDAYGPATFLMFTLPLVLVGVLGLWLWRATRQAHADSDTAEG